MKNHYFNVELEFDRDKVDSIIQKTISNKGKGYVCSIESNNLTVANNSPDFLKVVNGSLVNICDGSMLAKILGLIHNKPYYSYVGADLFIKYIKMNRYKQFFLGNTRQILDALKENLSKIDPSIKNMPFEELPFRDVENFDYKAIAALINNQKPDIIWVSLGAPKQEYFMNKLLPYLEQGVMFGFGAIFNFNANIGEVKRAPDWMINLRLEWLYRAFEEPKKNIPRYSNFVKILPRLIIREKRKLNALK
ncbi:WecB/TagA/CpsF family glycosyltransferase [Lutimonas zeaxanthinifaciens]|uniref:WecB/TagA/CpsF family glycosyltransferase n=1 Tax=Lutimonas zeaxanthinifaciens TaxID=3060215 RepID=UPI00265D0CD7|nr:WecB/TagA/CpsF family glycosyltransferase [Lutimonas sp. YSD2104]WKK66470.1 WecB/TagA/CpsF family glycosyltransferase [Lutimonas sp. YSD2104]